MGSGFDGGARTWRHRRQSPPMLPMWWSRRSSPSPHPRGPAAGGSSTSSETRSSLAPSLRRVLLILASAWVAVPSRKVGSSSASRSGSDRAAASESLPLSNAAAVGHRQSRLSVLRRAARCGSSCGAAAGAPLARSASSRSSAEALTVARRQMEASTPPAASLSRRTEQEASDTALKLPPLASGAEGLRRRFGRLRQLLGNATSHADPRSHGCSYAPAMQHSGGADVTVALHR